MTTAATPATVGDSAGLPPAHSGVRRAAPAVRKLLGYLILVTFAVAFVAPFLLALTTTFKSRPEAASHLTQLLPMEVTGRAWRFVFSGDVARWTFNSVVVTLAVTAGRIFLDSLAGYALARMKWPGRSAVLALVISTLAVPGIVLAIPRFIVMKELGLLNTYGGLILPLMVDAFGIFLMRQFFLGIPKEMEEAARIDGAGVFRTYWSVILPMARPGLITLTILSFQGSWNEFLHPLIAAPGNPNLRTLPVGLASLRGAFGAGIDFPILLAGSLIITIPVALVFLAFQRYFVQGLASSGTKG